MNEKMIYVFDIDGTICTNDNKDFPMDYTKSVPMLDRIEKINKLYDRGNTIIMLTARGMGRTNNNQIEAYKMFYDITWRQLREWGVKFHQLFLGKPSGDVYIDDKGYKDIDFFED